MLNRKNCKQTAGKCFKSHYKLFVFICLFASIIGIKYNSSTILFKYYTQKDLKVVETGTTTTLRSINQIASDILFGDEQEGEDILYNDENKPQEFFDKKIGNHLEIANSRGVLANVYNDFSTGFFLVKVFAALGMVLGSARASAIAWIILCLVVLLIIWTFFLNICQVIFARLFLESRIYKSMPISRAGFLIQTGKWIKASISMLIETIIYNLWVLTIVGGFIKYFSYFLVPYIIAENPSIGAIDAITLSRKMMNGHKMELFKLKLSFIGWDILNICTMGVLGLFFVNPYKEATYAEFYATIRTMAKENNIENIDLLNDTYLYEFADSKLLTDAYGVVEEPSEIKKPKSKLSPLEWIGNAFGIIIFDNEKEFTRSTEHKKIIHNRLGLLAVRKEIYPMSLHSNIKDEFRAKFGALYTNRRYSLCSLILMFLVMSVIGWIWEVCLHMMVEGGFVNRGTLHGPWLPIYGTGGVLILMILYRFRERPWLEFTLAIVLCGIIEYSSGYYLEMTHNGMKWWDYSGYFLNLDGRVCAEGLLVFGMGGMAIVYLLAPALDDIYRRINKRTSLILCIILSVLFIADVIYSAQYPNVGAGITSISEIIKYIILLC